MKPFSERNLLMIGVFGVAAVAGIVLIALQYHKLPVVNQNRTYSAYFAEAAGLSSGATVQVSGYPVGKVSSVTLESGGVLVIFDIDKNIHIGDRTEAAIKTKTLLGSKIVDVTPRGGGELSGPIPMERTMSPYELTDTLGELANTISGLNKDQLSDALATLSQTFVDSPPDLRDALQGVARFSQMLNNRDANLQRLLDNAARATGVLANRTDQVVGLVHDTNALLAQLQTQSAAVEELWNNVSAVSRQLKAFIGENRQELRPALDKLNGVLTIIDDRKERLQLAIRGLNRYAMQLGETLSSGPFFKVYIANLLPGQFTQPFVEAAFNDLGLDPATLIPSERTDPQTGQPGIPALPVPYPRTGQGGEPNTTLPDSITGNPGDPRYPYREPVPAPPPGGPPPGPPAVPTPVTDALPAEAGGSAPGGAR